MPSKTLKSLYLFYGISGLNIGKPVMYCEIDERETRVLKARNIIYHLNYQHEDIIDYFTLKTHMIAWMGMVVMLLVLVSVVLITMALLPMVVKLTVVSVPFRTKTVVVWWT